MVNKKIFMFLIMGIFLISMVSAELTTFDNVKQYDETTQTVTVKNLFGLGKTYAEIKLNTPLHNKVGLGYQKVAEFEIKGFTDYSDWFKEMEFYNLRDNWADENIVYDFRMKVEYEETLDKMVENCDKAVDYKNGTIICPIVKDGTYQLTRERWDKITPADIKENEVITIGIFTNTEKGDYKEWIPQFYGVRIDEWASWSASLNTGLVAFYDFDEPSGSIIDNASTNDGTNQGGAQGFAGKIGQSIDFDATEYATIPDGVVPLNSLSISFWYNKDAWAEGDSNHAMMGQWDDQSGNKRGWFIQISSSVIAISISSDGTNQPGNDVSVSGLSLSEDTWYFITITKDGTNGTIYLDGLPKKSDTLSATIYDFSGTTLLSRITAFAGASRPDAVTLDAMGVWNRALTDAEVLELYNGGDGCGYNDCLVFSPKITLNSPVDEANQTNNTVLFNTTITVVTPDNVTLYLNGVINETDTAGTLGDYLFTKILSDGSHDWIIESCAVGVCANSSERTVNIDTTPFIEFLTPPTLVNYANITQEYIPMKVNVSTLYYFNVSFDLYNANGTLFTQYYETETFDINFTNIPDAHYHYNVTTCTTTNQCNTTETRHINHNTEPPEITGTGNLTDLNVFALPTNSTWNFTVTDDHLSECWYNNVSGGANYSVTCNSYINTTWTTQGNKTLTYCANDTFGFETCATSYIWVYLLSYTQADTPDPIAEGFDATFNFTINRTNIPVTTANLIINNTVYVPTATAGTNGYLFEVEVTIPDGWGNTTGIVQDWLWNYTITGIVTNQNTSTTNITVYELAMDDCSSYGEVILDLYLKDEELATILNGSLGGQVEIDLRLTSKDDATSYLDFNNTWLNETNPQVCLPLNVLNNSQYWIDFTIGFDFTDHVWEFYYLDDGTLNLTKQFNPYTDYQIDLMDLLTADSTSFLFNYFDVDGLAVEDAMVHVYRRYIGSGEFLEVERSKADQNGDTIVHLVEEDVIYYFVITQYGEILFNSSQYTALCQATPCTIQIEASGDGATFGTDWDLLDNGAYVLSSNADTRQVNLTYSFNTTSTVNLTVYKYENDGSYTAIDTASSTGTAETMLITVPQSAGNVSFFASVIVDEDFINSEWIDFEQKSSDFFGTTLALFLGALIILTLGLMAVTEGTGTLVMVILGVVIAGALGLVRTELSTGINIIVYLVVAGGILLWKLTGGRK